MLSCQADELGSCQDTLLWRHPNLKKTRSIEIVARSGELDKEQHGDLSLSTFKSIEKACQGHKELHGKQWMGKVRRNPPPGTAIVQRLPDKIVKLTKSPEKAREKLLVLPFLLALTRRNGLIFFSHPPQALQ